MLVRPQPAAPLPKLKPIRDLKNDVREAIPREAGVLEVSV
jgi:hypothetical protein